MDESHRLELWQLLLRDALAENGLWRKLQRAELLRRAVPLHGEPRHEGRA